MPENKEKIISQLRECFEVGFTIVELFEELNEKYGISNERELMTAIHASIDELTIGNQNKENATESRNELKKELRIFIKYLTIYHVSWEDFHELYGEHYEIYDKASLLASIHAFIDDLSQINKREENATDNKDKLNISQLKIKLREFIEYLNSIQELHEKIYEKYGIKDKIDLKVSFNTILSKLNFNPNNRKKNIE